uniref:Uncharacterized protein n=1 Tax=Peronospora matthiolae TaxID=2874970 RepID=A0AAV1TLH5_9STRA
MEAEFVAASDMARELVDLREVDMVSVIFMIIRVDNQAIISQIDGEASSLEAKHIGVRLKFISDFARREIVKTQYVRSELKLADLLTKAMDVSKLATLRGLMQLA